MAEVNLAEIKFGVAVGDRQVKFSAKFSGYTVLPYMARGHTGDFKNVRGAKCKLWVPEENFH